MDIYVKDHVKRFLSPWHQETAYRSKSGWLRKY